VTLYFSILLIIYTEMKKLLFFGVLFLSHSVFAQIPYGSNTKVGKRVQVGDISMYYEIYGKGEPLILLHGGYGSSEMMGGMIEAFSKKYQVIAVDSRSQGRTTDSDEKELTYNQMALDVNGFMDKLQIKKAKFVGWSDGGDIALELALTHPEKITKAVVIGANFLGESSGVFLTVDTTWRMNPNDPLFAKTKKELAKYLSTYERMAPDKSRIESSKKKALTNVYNNPKISLAQLNSIQVPFLVMAGDHDMFTIEHTIALFKNLPQASLYIVPDATHISPWEEPELVHSEILRYLGKPYRKLDALYFFK
jgi:pimeloyl-ACP methyl ester carboxylesterase